MTIEDGVREVLYVCLALALTSCDHPLSPRAGARVAALEVAIMHAALVKEPSGAPELDLDDVADDGIAPPDWCLRIPANRSRQFHYKSGRPGWTLRYVKGKAVPKSCRHCGAFSDLCAAIQRGFRTKAECETAGENQVCNFFSVAIKNAERVVSAPSADCFWDEGKVFRTGHTEIPRAYH